MSIAWNREISLHSCRWITGIHQIDVPGSRKYVFTAIYLEPSYAYEHGKEASALCSSSCQPPCFLPLPPPLPLLELVLLHRLAVPIDHHHGDQLLSVAGAQGEVGRHVRCDAIQTWDVYICIVDTKVWSGRPGDFSEIRRYGTKQKLG